MSDICPTVTAFDTHEYRVQIERLEPFAERIHIDMMDGKFTTTISPNLDQIWWPLKLTADIHLMYQNPMDHIHQLIHLKPNLVVIHAEASLQHQQFTARLHDSGIKAGIALLHETQVDSIKNSILCYDHVLIFSGDLGKHGGLANLSLLQKVTEIRNIHPDAEISWDGGINDTNAAKLIDGGVSVLNVGGYIQKSQNPQEAYAKLKAIT